MKVNLNKDLKVGIVLFLSRHIKTPQTVQLHSIFKFKVMQIVNFNNFAINYENVKFEIRHFNEGLKFVTPSKRSYKFNLGKLI